MAPVRVVIVDDSLFVRSSVGRLLAVDPRIRFVGSAASGSELIDHWSRWQPDVVILDLAMPGMSGLETLDWIMGTQPVPVVILSTHSQEGAALTFEALDRGAFDFIDKQQYSLVDYQALREVLVERVLRAASHWRDEGPPQAPPLPRPPRTRHEDFRLLAIGASIGGPPAVRTVLAGLGRPNVPIVIVQHMLPHFVDAFAEHLNGLLRLRVRTAGHGDTLEPGTAYVAPGAQHLRVRERGAGLRAQLLADDGKHPHCPAVDVLFDSCADHIGGRVLAVLLTGMGHDGAEGMARLAAQGAYTLAQDQATSVVYSMPCSAVMRGAVREELPLPAIGPRIRTLLSDKGDDRLP